MPPYEEFYRRSIDRRDEFWAEQSALIDWYQAPTQISDFRRPPFVKWFVGGYTNLCYNAVDRHAVKRPHDPALIYVSSETNTEKTYSYVELQQEVIRMAACYLALGVKRGDRVIIYLPMIAEAAFAMLACARIGAIHSVVFGGFAANALASRIDDARPVLIVSADAGIRSGKVIPYKPLLDEACRLVKHPPAKILLINRGLAEMPMQAGRDVDYQTLRQEHLNTRVDITWLESNEPSYILYTSGTTGAPKGVQRDVGGYAVALAASMRHIFCGFEGETMFSTSDIGWVVGHSYVIYGPLIAGITTVMYEGTPLNPDPAVWWRIVEQYRVNVMFSAPTAIRVLKKQDPRYLKQHDLSSLKHLFLAGEPLDHTTHAWISEVLQIPVIDNYWQTETGWPMLSMLPGIEKMAIKFGSPGRAVFGFDLRLFREDGSECGANEKGIVGLVPPLPPGCMQTVWGQDERFVSTYFSLFETPLIYSSSDWGIRDNDGNYTMLGRIDDVINVAGHRLGTREIEEAVQAHGQIAEVAVVGVSDEIKGQVLYAFAVLKNAEFMLDPEKLANLAAEIMQTVDASLGSIARPARVLFTQALPKTRSGKMLRRSIQALAEGREAGDLSTLDDSGSLEHIRLLLRSDS